MDQQRELHGSGKALGKGFVAGSLEGWTGDLHGQSREKVGEEVEKDVDRSAGRSGKVSGVLGPGSRSRGEGEVLVFFLEWWKLWKGFKQKKITLGIHFWKVTLDQRDMWLH